jgi:uncharacterized Zn finger protein
MKSTPKKIKFSKKNPATTIPPTCNCVKKEVTRILASNAGVLDEEAVPFARSFYSILIKEAEENVEVKAVEEFSPEQDKEAFEQSLEAETPKDQFDIEGTSPSISSENIKKVDEWAGKLDEFANFLNDPANRESLHKILADADRPGSVLRGVTRKTSDAITRVAGEIKKIGEVLNSFVIMAPKKLRDTEQVTG